MDNQNDAPTTTNPLNPTPPIFQPSQQSGQPFPQNSPQPTTNPSIETLPSPAKPQKLLLVLSAIAFTLLSIAFLILGPGVLIAALLTQPFSWIISFYYIYLVVGTAIISLISLVLYTIAFILALKKTSRYLTNISIMLAGSVIGLATMWLSGYNIIHLSTIIATIIMSACILLPCIGLIILHRRRKHNTSPPKPSRPRLIFTLITLIILFFESGVAIFYLFQLWQEYKPILEANQQYQQEQEKLLAEATNGKDLSNQLSSMSFALCQGNFNIVHQVSGSQEGAIIECNPSGDIYELHSAHEKQNNYIIASTIYYGSTNNETLSHYFPNQLFIYKNLYNTSYNEEVYLLLQANSVEEVIEKYSEPLYEYIKASHTDTDFEIYYNEKLNTVTTTKDYIIIAGASHNIVNGWLPHGNGFNSPRGEYYIFQGVDDLRVLNDLAMNPDKYSKQANNAVKFHPHLSFSITDSNQITLKELQTIMYNSQICQNSDLEWEPCNQEN